MDMSQCPTGGTIARRDIGRSGETRVQPRFQGIELTRLRHIILLGMAVLLVGSAPAVAQDSSIDDGYGGPPAETTSSGGGKLPFSGLDLGLIAAGGALFVVAGVGLRRAVRTD